jgi:hypothetical protein
MSDLKRRLIRLAYSKPKLRPYLLPLLQKYGGADKSAAYVTWGRLINDARRKFTEEVLGAAQQLALDEGFSNVRGALRGNTALLTAVNESGALTVRYFWVGEDTIGGESELARTAKKKGKTDVSSMDPNMVAAEFFYAHLQGVVP